MYYMSSAKNKNYILGMLILMLLLRSGPVTRHICLSSWPPTLNQILMKKL